MMVQRVESGISGLDKIIEGGFVKGSNNLIAGGTGTAKTIFGCQYILHGLRKGESGVYLSLEQKEEDVLADVSRFDWDTEFRRYARLGKFVITSIPPTSISELQSATLPAIKRINASRFVLDSLSIASMGWKVSSMDIGKIRSEIFDYLAALKATGCTSLLIVEIPEAESKKLSRFGFEEFLADSVIIMHYLEYAAGGFPRSILVRKMRRTDHGTGVYPFEITSDGIVVKKR